MATSESFPGKKAYRDENENYYFSCSHVDEQTKHPSVVLGSLQKANTSNTSNASIQSTCPLMGIRRIWDTSRAYTCNGNGNGYMDEWPEVLLRLERAAVEQSYCSDSADIKCHIMSTANNGGFGNSDGTFIAMFPQIVLEDIFRHEPITFREYLGIAPSQTNEDDDTQDDIIVLLFTEVGIYEINTRVG